MEKTKARSLFKTIYTKLLGYTIIVFIILYIGSWIFIQSVVHHDAYIIEYLITTSTEISLSTFDQILGKEETLPENTLLSCLNSLNENMVVPQEKQCENVIQLVISPTGTIIISNSYYFQDINFSDLPFFPSVASATEHGKIAIPRAFILGTPDNRTFYKFVFAPLENGNILGLALPIQSDINIRSIFQLSMRQIVKDIDVVQDLEVVYPTTQILSNYDSIKITPEDFASIDGNGNKTLFRKIEKFIGLPSRTQVMYTWLSKVPSSSDNNIVYIPQPYIIYMDLNFSPLLREFFTSMYIVSAIFIAFILLSGITIFMISKNITLNINNITDVLRKWKNINKHSPHEIENFLKELKNRHSKLTHNIREIHDMTESFTETIETLLAFQRQLMHNNMLLEESYKELEEKQESLRRAYYFFARRLAKLAEQFDNETGEHISRVGDYSAFIAEKLGFPPEVCEDIRRFAPLHDIGKILIPQSILNKKGPLTPEEWEIMKKHTIYGWEILGGEEDNEMPMAKNIARWHHEKWDGSGYPDGLKGEQIPIEARIVALADIYDALRSPRPYKKALSHEEVVKIILEGDGRTSPNHFDPQILQIFRKYHQVFDEIYRSNT